MIACISPGFSSADHTLNTLRYAQRLKEKEVREVRDVKEIKDSLEEFKGGL
jgi:kinesin family protein 2/24